jgi:hypothetical protein
MSRCVSGGSFSNSASTIVAFHSLEARIDDSDSNRCRVIPVGISLIEALPEAIFDDASFVSTFRFRARSGRCHVICGFAHSYMTLAVLSNAIVSPVSFRPISYRIAVSQSNRHILFANSRVRKMPRISTTRAGAQACVTWPLRQFRKHCAPISFWGDL